MKQIFTFFIFLFSFSTLFAQTLYTRKDTISITQDSVTLKAGAYTGKLQWQHSLDGKNWDNLSEKTNPQLKVAKEGEGYYRAKLTEETCFPTYSDTAVIVVSKAGNSMVTSPGQVTGTIYLGRDNGTFTFVSTSGTTIPVNTVFVDSEQESDIRVVSGVTQNGDTLTVNTEPGTMEDLFRNIEFKLTSEMIDNTEKGAYLTKEALAKAMVDGKGFIHPVEVIDNNSSIGLKDAQIVDESLPTINFTNDFSGESLWSEGGADISISEGFYKLGAVLNYEFLFSPENFDWDNKTFPKGKLQKFKIYTDKEKTGAEAKLVLTASTSHSFSKESDDAIVKGVFSKTFKYLIVVPSVPPIVIPFWAKVNVDLMKSSSAEFSGEASVSGGLSSDLDIEIGASYEDGQWKPIQSITPEFSLIGPDVDAKVNVKAKVWVYPHIEVQFYSTLAPYLEIGPYLREEMERSATGNYKYDLCSGVDANIGIKADILGHEIFDFKKGFNVKEDTLYTAPKKVKVVSGGNQKGILGKPLTNPIVLKVLDSKDNPVKNTLVHFTSEFGKLFKSLLPESNAESKSALIAAGDSTELTITSDSIGRVSINYILSDTTAKQKLVAYLKNGKDSIIKESKDTISAETCGCDTTKFEYFTDTRDGHKYKTIEIGTQTWMAENLTYLAYNTPTNIWSETTPCYYEYNNTTYFAPDLNYSPYYEIDNNHSTHGVLYNWPAAKNACPAGWHLPGDLEWTILENYLTNNNYGYEGDGNDIAQSMASPSGWTPNVKLGTPGNDFASNNSSCFSALPVGKLQANNTAEYHYYGGCQFGYYTPAGESSLIIEDCFVEWWSNTEYGLSNAWRRNMYSETGLLYRYEQFKGCGLSVRCVKN